MEVEQDSYRKEHDLNIGEGNSGQIEALANNVKVLTNGFFGNRQNDVNDGGIVEAVKLNSEERKNNAEMKLRTKVRRLWKIKTGIDSVIKWFLYSVFGATILVLITLYLTNIFNGETKIKGKTTVNVESK